MKTSLPVIVLSLFGLLALTIGMRGLISPASLAASLGYALSGVDGLNEVRAQYGGFFVAVATVCALAIFRPGWREPALVVLVVTFGGILLGRIASVAIDGGFGSYGSVIKSLFVVDLVGLLAAASALVVQRGRA